MLFFYYLDSEITQHMQEKSEMISSVTKPETNSELPAHNAKKKLYFNPAYFDPEMLQVSLYFR